jgi:nucleotide-binding universal stress UspA family protein
MFARILLATDGSPVVERLLLYAEHLGRVEPAEVVVLHAYTPPQQYADVTGYGGLLEQYRLIAEAVVADAVQALEEMGVRARGEVRLGPAAEAIVEAVVEEGIDLVVLGRGGSSGLEELLGSVSAQVLRQARCPVIQIP